MPFNLLKNLNKKHSEYSRVLQRGLLVVVVLLAVSFVSLEWGNGRLLSFWSDIQTKNQPYTELAFDNIANLPYYIPYDGQISFSFMVHNVEGNKLSYPYVISIKNGSTTTLLKQGSVSLANNNRTSVNENLVVSRSTSKQEVAVTLPNQKESIDFWVIGTN
jgi:hypothetical protein